MSKFKFLATFIAVLLVSFTGLAVADSNLDLTLTSSSLSAQHGSSASGSFSLKNNNATSTITLSSCLVSAQGGTTSCQLASSSLSAGQTQTDSFTVSVLQFTPPGNFSGTVTVAGTLPGGAAVSDSKTFNVVVASTPSLSVSWDTPPVNLFQEQNQTVTFTVTNDGNLDLLLVTGFMDLSEFGLSNFNQNFGTLSMRASVTKTVSVTTSSETKVGPHTLSLVVNGNGTSGSLTTSTTSQKSFEVLFPFCDVNATKRSPVRLEEVKNDDKIRDKTFNPLDSMKVELKVSNSDQDDSHKAIAKIVVVHGSSEVSDTDEEVKEKINKDDTKTVRLNVTLPADMNDGTNYLYVKVENDDDDKNCFQQAIPFEVKRSSREIVPVSVDNPLTLVCGESFTFNGKAANIGNSDEDKVLVSLRAFGKDYEQTFDNLDSGDTSSTFSFDVNVPKNETGSNKRMTLKFWSDYDSDKKDYSEESDTFDYLTTVTCPQTKEDSTAGSGSAGGTGATTQSTNTLADKLSAQLKTNPLWVLLNLVLGVAVIVVLILLLSSRRRPSA